MLKQWSAQSKKYRANQKFHQVRFVAADDVAGVISRIMFRSPWKIDFYRVHNILLLRFVNFTGKFFSFNVELFSLHIRSVYVMFVQPEKAAITKRFDCIHNLKVCALFRFIFSSISMQSIRLHRMWETVFPQSGALLH